MAYQILPEGRPLLFDSEQYLYPPQVIGGYSQGPSDQFGQVHPTVVVPMIVPGEAVYQTELMNREWYPIPVDQVEPIIQTSSQIPPGTSRNFQHFTRLIEGLYNSHVQGITHVKRADRKGIKEELSKQIVPLFQSLEAEFFQPRVGSQDGQLMSMVEHGWINYQLGCLLRDAGELASGRHYFLTCAGFLAHSSHVKCPSYSRQLSEYILCNTSLRLSYKRCNLDEVTSECNRLRAQGMVCVASYNATCYLNKHYVEDREQHFLERLRTTLTEMETVGVESFLLPENMTLYQDAKRILANHDYQGGVVPVVPTPSSISKAGSVDVYQHFFAILTDLGHQYLANIACNKGEQRKSLQIAMTQEIENQNNWIRVQSDDHITMTERNWLSYQSGCLLRDAKLFFKAQPYFETCAGWLEETDTAYSLYSRKLSTFIREHTSLDQGCEHKNTEFTAECNRLRARGLVALAQIKAHLYITVSDEEIERLYLGSLGKLFHWLQALDISSFLEPDDEKSYQEAVEVYERAIAKEGGVQAVSTVNTPVTLAGNP